MKNIQETPKKVDIKDEHYFEAVRIMAGFRHYANTRIIKEETFTCLDEIMLALEKAGAAKKHIDKYKSIKEIIKLL